MKIQAAPFAQIKSGQKIIESRLFDEKRQRINVGDEIEFSLAGDSTQIIKAEVLGLSIYETFSDLFDSFPASMFGGKDKEDLMSIYQYYSKEEEQKYKVLGIHLKRIK